MSTILSTVTMRRSRPSDIGPRSTRSRSAAPALGLVLALSLALSACGGEESTAEDPAAGSASAPPSATAPFTEDAAGERDFTATDYAYRLELICFCPLVGPVDVVVTDGEVTSTSIVKGAEKGEPAPEFYELTIAEILDRAREPEVDEAEVTWPEDSDHPTSVAIDPIRMATDDEITYRIKGLRLEP